MGGGLLQHRLLLYYADMYINVNYDMANIMMGHIAVQVADAVSKPVCDRGSAITQSDARYRCC